MRIIPRIFDEDRRLVFLKLLAKMPDYTSPHYAIRDALAHLGHAVSMDKAKTDAAWLEEQGLVSITRPAEGLEVYRLTSRGKDVSENKATVPGVKQPEPGLDDF